MKTVAIIPARGGSKGIPRKNLYPFNGKPLIRNQVLAATFKKMGIIEQWGSGTAKIFAECIGNPPTYKETGGFFKVTFPRPTKTNKQDEGVNGGVNNVPKIILMLMKNHPGLRNNEIRGKLALSQ